MRKNLILAAVGDESVHPTWLSCAARSFDVALVYFGDRAGQFADDAEYYFARKGIKFSMLHEVVHRDLGIDRLLRYEYVWMPDDDIAADSFQVERLFHLSKKHQLAICQPGIGRGDVSFQALRANPDYVLRYSRFVEIMCPLFSRAALMRVLPTFNVNASGWGIDWLWASMFGSEDLAVIDATPVHHTRPLSSGGVHTRLAKLGVNPLQELTQLVRQYGIDNRRFHRATRRGTSRLRGIRLDGELAWTRSLLPTIFRRKAA